MIGRSFIYLVGTVDPCILRAKRSPGDLDTLRNSEKILLRDVSDRQEQPGAAHGRQS